MVLRCANNNYRLEIKEPIRNVIATDPDHDAHHTGDLGENHVRHTHLKHQMKVTTQQINSMLRTLNTCPQIKALSEGKTILTKKVRKDILNKFKKFDAKGRGGYWKESNNQDYTWDTMPTMYEHSLCLSSAKDSTGCIDYKPIEVVTNNTMLHMTIGGVLGILSVGLFARAISKTCSSPTPVAKEKAQTQPPKKEKYSTRSRRK